MKNALIIFIKTPKPGLVKTRLQPDFTEDQSAELYSAFLKDIDNTFHNQDDFLCWYAVSPEDFEKDILAQSIHMDNYFLQQGRDLGERMHNAFQTFFSKGYEKIVLIGSDLPSITVDIISQALQGLESKDCVIGPSRDGGYYLIAMSRLCSVLFKDLPWSTSEVFGETIKILDEKDLSYVLLPEHEDIDTHKELISFYQNYKEKNRKDPDFPTHSWSITSRLIEKRKIF
jgi:rSAM/selenodomain-associated transferase 1